MAAARKTTAKKTRPAPKVTKIKKFNLDISGVQKKLPQEFHKHPSFYSVFATLLVILLLLIGLFFFKRNVFLAGTINGRLVSTPEFYQSLVKNGGSSTFDSIVRDTLIQQEADKKGLKVSSKEIDDRIATIEKRLGGKDNLDKAIAQNNTSMPELRRQIGLQLLAEKILAKDLVVTDDDVKKFTDENKTQVEGLSADEIKDQVKSQKFNDKFATWLEDLKKNAKIVKYF